MEFSQKQINENNQIFWVCPLISESKFLNYSSAIKKFDLINKRFPGEVGLIHGSIQKDQKDTILKKFLEKKFPF